MRENICGREKRRRELREPLNGYRGEHEKGSQNTIGPVMHINSLVISERDTSRERFERVTVRESSELMIGEACT